MLVVLHDVAGVNEDDEPRVMQVDDDNAQHDELKDLLFELQLTLYPGCNEVLIFELPSQIDALYK